MGKQDIQLVEIEFKLRKGFGCVDYTRFDGLQHISLCTVDFIRYIGLVTALMRGEGDLGRCCSGGAIACGQGGVTMRLVASGLSACRTAQAKW